MCITIPLERGYYDVKVTLCTSKHVNHHLKTSKIEISTKISDRVLT